MVSLAAQHTLVYWHSECVEDVARWFLENGLLLNPAKTGAVLFRLIHVT